MHLFRLLLIIIVSLSAHTIFAKQNRGITHEKNLPGKDLIPASAEVKTLQNHNSQYILGRIDSEVDSVATAITIRFDKKLDIKDLSLSEHGSFFQIRLPQTVIPDSGKFYDINSAYFTKVSPFQVTASEGAIRIFVKRAASDLKDVIKADILNDRIVIVLNHAQLEKKGIFDHLPPKVAENPVKTAIEDKVVTARTEQFEHNFGKVGTQPTMIGVESPSELSTSAEKAQEIIAKTEIRNDIPDPMLMIKEEKEKEKEVITNSVTEDNADLKQKVKNVAIGSAVLLALFLISSWFKKTFIKFRSGPLTDDSVIMKMVASQTLAPKHKITLIQVGEEKILLGVSPDGIKFLTNIGPSMNSSPKSFNQYLSDDGERPRQRIAERSTLNDNNETKRKSAVHPAYSLSDDILLDGKQGAQSHRSKNTAKPITLESNMPRGRKINAVIGDGGVRNINESDSFRSIDHESTAKAIEDVTTLIRRKIKNMPSL